MIKLSQEEAAEVMALYTQYPADLAHTLTRAGYALCAVSGPALEQARGTLPPVAPEQAERLDQWCRPDRVS